MMRRLSTMTFFTVPSVRMAQQGRGHSYLVTRAVSQINGDEDWSPMTDNEKRDFAINLNLSEITDPEYAFKQGEGYVELGVGFTTEALNAFEHAKQLDPNYKALADARINQIKQQIKPNQFKP